MDKMDSRQTDWWMDGGTDRGIKSTFSGCRRDADGMKKRRIISFVRSRLRLADFLLFLVLAVAVGYLHRPVGHSEQQRPGHGRGSYLSRRRILPSSERTGCEKHPLAPWGSSCRTSFEIRWVGVLRQFWSSLSLSLKVGLENSVKGAPKPTRSTFCNFPEREG